MSAWASVSHEELLVALVDVQTQLNSLEARALAVVAEVDSRGLAVDRGYRDTVDLLRSAQRVSRATASARVEAARQVVPQRTLIGAELAAGLPETAVALACAEISLEHVTVIRRTLAALPAHLQAERHSSLERDLAEIALTVDPEGLAKAGKRALALLDPDGPRPREGFPTRNRLRFSPLGAGFQARGWFDRESVAILRTALSPLAAPAAEHGAGECEGSGCDHASGERQPDPRSVAERDGDGLVELCRRMLESGALPVDGGARPQIVVTIPLSELRGEGAGLLGFGDGLGRSSIPAEAVRRWACDAGIVPVVLGGRGEPLDVGRASRLVTSGMRRALDQRDGGCAHPGCDVPARWTNAHHVVHWARGGVTAVGNLVLLCPRHHRLIHKGEWTITMEGGIPLFHPPRWAGGPPSRNMIHRADLLGRLPAPRERSAVPVVVA